MRETIPEFSIVIPVYNTVNELPRCINSILEQKFKNYEVILVDDGSTDGSSDVCDDLCRKYSQIHVIHKENGGAAEARNTGIFAAVGEYLLFVDSDDMWSDPNALLDLDQIVDKQRVDLICFGVKIIDAHGNQEKIRCPQRPIAGGYEKESIVRHLVYKNQYFSASYVKAIRRDFFVSKDLFFIKGLLSEDIEWSFRVLIECKDISIYPNPFYKRIRREEGSLTAAISKKNIIAILDSIDAGIISMKNLNITDSMRALYYEYWSYQYAMLLGLVQVMKDDKEYLEVLTRLKSLKWLLKYDHVRKVWAVHMLCNILSVKGAVKVLGIYYRMK